MSENENEERENIIILPEYKELQDEISRLHTELSMLLLERDQLKFVECKNIEMEYMLTLGELEYKALELQCDMLRLKRKSEIIQSKINRMEKISIREIDEMLDKEFQDYKRKLNKQIGKMNDAIKRSNGTLLSDEEEKEFKSMYRTIVKALHPDINPNLTDEQIELFRNAVTAYENGDLNTMRIINSMVAGSPSNLKTGESSMAALTKERDRLREMLDTIKEQIEKIKSKYPYTLKALLNDSELVAVKKAELEEIIENFRARSEIYKKRIDELMR
ncbi:MAG: hypothetical protein LUG85_05210 [Clostridiales bacterium]|nr:hypothetical protein [Clostridiales bacterium]